jgi:hypothetical protein
VLGDDSEGSSKPRSTAIAVGKRTVLACAHSLNMAPDPKKRCKQPPFVYVEDYWIQPRVSICSTGAWSNDDRISIRLYKFHPDHDWALFERTDGKEFSNYARIDTTPSSLPANVLPNLSRPMVLLHCPVKSLLKNYPTRVGEYATGCNRKNCVIQSQSAHHIYYDGGNLVGGSSGGAVQWADTNELFAMHCGYSTEVEMDEEEITGVMTSTSKLVKSEDQTYEEVTTDIPLTKKPRTCGSKTVRSLVGGNQGQGRAVIVSQCKKLMFYLNQIESS